MKGNVIFVLFFLVIAHLQAQIGKTVEILPDNVTSYRSVNSMSQVVQSEDNAVITGWRSARQNLAYNNIYLQKTDIHGNLIWEKDGTPVCSYPANQANFNLIGDGYGGVVVVWEDSRFGADKPAIYAQRINLRGEQLWGNEGIRLCTSNGAQKNPQIVTNLGGGFYVVWEDQRKGINESDIYAQKVDLSGSLRWGNSGLAVCEAAGLQKEFSLSVDEKQNIYVAWEDFRNGVYWNLYAQKIDENGTNQWKLNGLDIFAGVEENHHHPQIVTDGYGGFLFVYQKYSSETHGTDIYRGRLNAGGEVVFHFATCYEKDEQVNPQIIKKGGKALLCWEDRRDGNWDLYAQMIRLKDGLLEWNVNGVPVVNTPADERDPVLISSTSYGYQVFSWLRSEGKNSRVFVQKLNNLGDPSWDLEGKPICGSSIKQEMPAILTDEAGGLWCTWTDRREYGVAYVYIQHVNARGLPLFKSDGVKLGGEQTQAPAEIDGVYAISGRTGEFYVTWSDFRNGKDNPDIYLQKIDAKGQPAWRRGGIPVCIAEGSQSRPILVDDGVGGVIIAWIDRRHKKGDDIYAQRVSSWGKLLWRREGVKVCGAPSSQSALRGISDGNEGAIFCWVDARNMTATGFDLYLQRVGHDGETLWMEDGRPFANNPGLQTSPRLVEDGAGGAFVCWMDSRNDTSNIYVQHFNSSGLELWQPGGRLLAASNYHQRHPMISMNQDKDLFIVWQEGRFGDGQEKLFMQCMTQAGMKLWRDPGIQICNHYGRQSNPQIVSDINGTFWIAWLDERLRKINGVQLRMQKYSIGGKMQWKEDGVLVGENLEEWNDFELDVNTKGEAYVIWDQMSGSGTKEVMSQRMDQNGELKYGAGGLKLSKSPGKQFSPELCINSEDKMILIWSEGDDKYFRILCNILASR